jgi:hypothetical protein
VAHPLHLPCQPQAGFRTPERKRHNLHPPRPRTPRRGSRPASRPLQFRSRPPSQIQTFPASFHAENNRPQAHHQSTSKDQKLGSSRPPVHLWRTYPKYSPAAGCRPSR